MTVDTQPSIHRHLRRGWPVSFADGRGTWNDASTALRSEDWFAFRDPGQQWERPFYEAGSAAEQQIEAAVRSATEEGLFADFSPEWTAFLTSQLQVPAFLEHGLWFALATAARDCLSDTSPPASVCRPPTSSAPPRRSCCTRWTSSRCWDRAADGGRPR